MLIKKIGRRAKLIAEHSCRVESNLVDTLRALETIGYSEAEIRQSLATPKVEVPFCREVPEFPVRAANPRSKSNYGYTEDNVPVFLPPFPAAHTYLHTPVPVSRSLDDESIKELRAKEKREIEELLAEISKEEGQDVEMGESRNPFLALGDIGHNQSLV